MSQHDFVLDNATAAALRADLNLALLALASCSAGTSAPASPVTYQLWLDTTTATAMVLAIYDGTDWITLFTINTTANTASVAGALENVVEDTTPQAGGTWDMNNKQMRLSKGADVVATGALPLMSDGNYFDVTGSTTITSMDDLGADGTIVTLHFDAAPLLTHHATNLILPGGINYQAAAGDEITFVNYSTGDYRCIGYSLASGETMATRKGSDIASAAPLVVPAASNYYDVTGTTGFAAMTVAAGRLFTLQFDGALIMTHHATNLDLPGEANITTAAGDVGLFFSTGANTVQCLCFTKADGTAVVGAGGAWNLIGTVVASSDATITVTGLDSTYDTFAIQLSDIVPATDSAVPFLRVGDSGGVDSAASDYSYATWGVDSNETWVMVGITDETAAEIKLSTGEAARDPGSAAGEGLGGMLFLHRPGDGTTKPMISGNVVTLVENVGSLVALTVTGSRNAVITLDRIQFLFDTGNVATGRLTVWGIAHA